jgi:hypothetical protein
MVEFQLVEVHRAARDFMQNAPFIRTLETPEVMLGLTLGLGMDVVMQPETLQT